MTSSMAPDFQFGNTGKLTDTLAMVLREAP